MQPSLDTALIDMYIEQNGRRFPDDILQCICFNSGF